MKWVCVCVYFLGLKIEGLYHEVGVCVYFFWIDSMLRAYIMEVGWLCERDVAEGRLTVQLQKPLQRDLVKDHMEFVTGSQN